MSINAFDDIINNKTNNTYFSTFEKLFFKKLKMAWDDYHDPHDPNPEYPLTERLIDCFNEAKQEVIELKKRRQYSMQDYQD